MANPDFIRSEDGTIYIKVAKDVATTLVNYMAEFEEVEVDAEELYASDKFASWIASDVDNGWFGDMFEEGLENCSPSEDLGYKTDEDYEDDDDEG